MIKELWCLIRIEYMLIRELNLKLKLVKHQNKMFDTFVEIEKEFTKKHFIIDGVQEEFNQLKSRIGSRFD